MIDFKQNNCRICKSVFCCKKCREKHETKHHNVFPGCEICISGKIVISTAPQPVIEHIKSVHWPLHCLFCKRLFGSVEELFQHIKCPLTKNIIKNDEKSPYSPSNTTNCSSPYIKEKIDYGTRLATISSLATSTPMQPEQGNNALKKIPEVIITPVDCSGNRNETNSLKRKVTFSDTPITESFTKKSKNLSSITDSQLGQFFTPSAILGASTFYTAMGTPIEKIMEDEELNDIMAPRVIITDDARKSKRTELTSVLIQEKMVWINVSSAKLCNSAGNEASIEFNISENQFFTPMIPKKKINVGAACLMEKKDEFDGPVHVSSTPNNSNIPAPNARDVFKNRSSTSKSDLDNWVSEEITKEMTSNISSTENSLQGNLWTSVTKLVKNVLHGFSTSLTENTASTSQPLKRYYSDQDLQEVPTAKRYKVADVQCRRPIRDMTPINKYMQSYRNARSREFRIKVGKGFTHKTFVDKATQTDDSLFID